MLANRRRKEITETIKKRVKAHRGKNIEDATTQDLYYVVSSIVRDEIWRNWQQTQEKYHSRHPKQVYYLSMEFLIGRLLESNLLNCNLLEPCNEALKSLGFEPAEVYAEENDPGLGNGGLGRLAACFIESMSSLGYPGHGMGIRYRYGMFEQRIINGYQTELPDYWLKEEYPWEMRKADEAIEVHYGGEVHTFTKTNGDLEFKYENQETVLAVPYDIPVVGYENQVVNTLRLWSAEAVSDNAEVPGNENNQYYKNLEYNRSVEQISGFLYPDDSSEEGKRLRVRQQYFLVTASLRSIIDNYKKTVRKSLVHLPEKIVIQINDTHPSLTIPELMRMLMDEEGFGWEEAWKITSKTVAYTNHTILSEALEKWPEGLIKSLLPRLYMIINEINERFCQGIWFDHPELRDKIPEMAIIADGQVHMARLAIVGSFSINGVAKLHTEILKKQEMKNFYALYPKRFNNKTNGITHRRWLLQANPRLAGLINETIGSSWIRHPGELSQLLRHANDSSLLEELGNIKKENKKSLANFIHERTGVLVDENSIFDVQIKRLHEYKRQLLNIFHVIYLYNQLKDNPNLDITPRTFIFGAKAAPSYHFAKEIIKLINTVANIVNYDTAIQGKLKVIFLENYNVSLAEQIIPAADISEQISTAGKEASGTGNMKLMMNGALTIGTLDGANIEIKNLVGNENIFIFGLNADEVYNYYQNNNYAARDIYHTDNRITRIMDQLNKGEFGPQDIAFKDIYYHILYNNDPYFILKDFDSYVLSHHLVDQAYRKKEAWLSKSLVNIAHSGKFSSDRTIQEYAEEIWKLRKL